MVMVSRAERMRHRVSTLRLSTRSAIVLVALFLGGCARATSVGSPPRPVFAVLVENTFELDMIVSYDAGAGPRALGAVAPGLTERFVLAIPEPGPVSISARSPDGSRVAGPYTVDLSANATPRVTLRPTFQARRPRRTEARATLDRAGASNLP